MPLSMRVQCAPQSVVFQRYGRSSSSWKRFAATYAMHSPKRDASMLDTRVNFDHVLRRDVGPLHAAVARDEHLAVVGTGPDGLRA